VFRRSAFVANGVVLNGCVLLGWAFSNKVTLLPAVITDYLFLPILILLLLPSIPGYLDIFLSPFFLGHSGFLGRWFTFDRLFSTFPFCHLNRIV
jgi:hypothetical protein